MSAPGKQLASKRTLARAEKRAAERARRASGAESAIRIIRPGDAFVVCASRLAVKTPNDRQIAKVAAQMFGLKFGPSLCDDKDADAHIKVQTSSLSESLTVVPVRYVTTRNAGILERQF